MAISGIHAEVGWKLENSFKGSATGNYKSFFQNEKIDEFTASNNVLRLYGLGDIEAFTHTPLNFNGTIGISGALADPWIFSLVTGNIPTSSGTGPYIHKFIDLNKPLEKNARSAKILVQLGNITSLLLDGCTISTFNLDIRTNEIVNCKASFIFSNLNKITSNEVISPIDEPYLFSHATLKIGGTTISEAIISASITINRNIEQIVGLGSRYSQVAYAKKTEYTAKATITLENTNYIDKLLNTSEDATLEIILDNGLSGTSQRRIELGLSGILTNELSMPIEVDDFVKNELDFSIKKIYKLEAINNTSTMP